MFSTVMHSLKSPQNVGTIVRTHVAFGGGPVVFVGSQTPWEFRKASQAFSRKLERLADLLFLVDDEALFEWCAGDGYTPVAIEISPDAENLPGYNFPARPAIIVGNERHGLDRSFLARCEAVVRIPQFGPADCLNVGVSCSIALYELNRQRSDSSAIKGGKYCFTAASNNGFEQSAH
jgi:23S rRNA (guanosine2251-2'-O)-methyltransferase